MVSWFENEMKMPEKVYNVPVGDLGFYETVDGKETMVESIPVCDLTNDEYVILQRDPFLDKYAGTLSERSSPKNQAYSILITYHRIYKAAEKLGKPLRFTANQMMKWSVTKSGNLAERIKDHLENESKKSASSQEVTNIKP